MSTAEDKAIVLIARDLYRAMPDNRIVPSDGERELWGEVDCTEQYKFCERIARHIVKKSGSTFVDLD